MKEGIDVIEYYNTPGMASGCYKDWKAGGGSTSLASIKKTVSILFPEFAERKGKMVDLGCGPGNNIPSLVELFKFSRVVAVDASPNMISFVKQNHPEIKTQLADLRGDSMNVESTSVDLVICSCTIPYLSKIDKLFSEVGRMLKSGGIFAFDIVMHEERHTDVIPVFKSSFPIKQYYYSENKIASLSIQNRMSCIYFMDLNNRKLPSLRINTSQKLFFLIKK